MRLCLHLLLTLQILLLGLCATAQTTTIPVQAGEHAQFTRLVIQIPEANSWRVTTDAMTARLDIDGPPLQFDLSQTFAKIPRTRLRRAVATTGRLELELACSCEIRASEDIPRYLVIDILGTGSPTAQVTVKAIRPPERPGHIERHVAPRSPEATRAGAILARAMRGHTPTYASVSSLTLRQFSGSTIYPAPRLEASNRQPEGTAAPSRIAIAQELGRVVAGSVAQGLLEPARSFDADAAPSGTKDEAVRYIDPALAAHLRLPFQDTAADRGKGTEICHDLLLLDLEDWTPGMLVKRTPQALHVLYGEFDTIDHQQGLDLIRYFLSLGFGAEARMVATLLDLPLPLVDMITGISHALDQERLPESIDLSALKDCSPSGSLWTFLGAASQHPMTGFPYERLVQSVEALPPHLRLHLGPAILQRLSALDQARPAMMIEAALDRVAEQPTAEFQLAKVALALSEAQLDRIEELENTLSPKVSDDALLFLFVRRDEQDEPVETDLIDLATSRLLALRGDPRGRELTRLLARALARNGDYTDAFARAQAWDTGFAANEVQKLRLDLLDHLTGRANDTEFVARIFEQRPWEIDKIPALSARGIASRLSGLGFDQQARLMQLPRTQHFTTDRDESSTLPATDTEPEEATPMTGSSSLPDPIDSGASDVNRARMAQRSAQSRSPAELGSVVEDTLESASTSFDEAVQTDRERDRADLESATMAVEAGGSSRAGSIADRQNLTQASGLLTLTRDALEQSAALRTRLEDMLNELD